MAEFTVDVPRDIEADILRGLEEFGINAGTEVQADIKAGTIRVSRTGGSLTAQNFRDRPTVLVEVWAEDSVKAFDDVVKVWAVFEVFRHRGFITEDAPITDLDLQPPRALDDLYAPELYRTQFTADMTTHLTQIVVKDKNG